MGKFKKKKLEWGGVHEKNRKAGLKASGKGGRLRCPKQLNSLHITKKTEGEQKYECYKSKVFFVSCSKQHIKFCCMNLMKTFFKYVNKCVHVCAYVCMYTHFIYILSRKD